GDLHYYSEDGNLGGGDVTPLASRPCPIYLLTGEYDLSATPALTAELARLIKPRHFEVMRGLGHFPMSEDPQLFLDYLRPVLERIAQDEWREGGGIAAGKVRQSPGRVGSKASQRLRNGRQSGSAPSNASLRSTELLGIDTAGFLYDLAPTVDIP